MISYPDALKIIADAIEPAPGVERALGDLDRCVTADAVASRLSVPPSDNSAMDGFAVRAADTAHASPQAPLELKVVGLIAAGDRPAAESFGSGAVEIMTGAPMPPGCDAIVPVEQVEVTQTDGDRTLGIHLSEPVAEGSHVRRSGQDFIENATVLDGGRIIEPHGVMGLAATGVDRLAARPAPRFAVITTGSELAATGIPSHDGLIRDSNGPYLGAFVRHTGGTLSHVDHVPDVRQSLEKAIADACTEADIVLTTGGVSAGRFDMVPDAVTGLDGEILFHKVAIRPGKPILFARLPGGKLFFGLPGNPMSVAVGLRFFVVPAARLLQGLPPETYHTATAVDRIRKPAKFRFFGKAHATVDAGGRIQARALPGQESFRIAPLLNSNCWAIVEEGPGVIEAGELIRIAPLYPTEFLQ
jgi:molybdopterin molybdotransferase